MDQLSFYRQARRDGGIRTGVDWDDAPLLHEFKAGSDAEEDPILTWSIDVRFEARSLPTDAEEARAWLLSRGDKLSTALLDLADELAVGIDVAAWPLHRKVAGLPRGTSGTIICAAQQRRYCRSLAAQARRMAEHWHDMIAALPVLQEATP